MRQPAVLGVALLAVAACHDATSPRDVATLPASVNAARAGASNDYIVTLHADETDPHGRARGLIATHGGSLKHVYRAALKGFAVAGLPDAAVEALRRNPHVAAIELDGVVSISGTQSPTPSWGLDRIDARTGLNNSYTYTNDGAGVTAYILDTGINPSHTDFAGRILQGVDFIDGGAPDDCNGHGTHVAGTVGGTVYGVAKNVRLVGVRVLNCSGSGTISGVIAGIDWVAINAIKPAVANMSLGGGFSSSLNTAVNSAVASGVTFAVAAGNSNANACNSSPASAGSAITVGATTSSDARASYSNYGSCLDIFAPGSSIRSAWIGSSSATNTISGTSMASPHVAGAAALYVAATPGATPAGVASALVTNATSGILGSIGTGSPNRLLYVGFIGGGGTQPPPPPPADVAFSVSCNNGFTCTFDATNGFTSYSWDFGDGSSGSGDGATHTYARKGGSYTVTLTVPNGSATGTVSCNPKKGCK
jgi:subtilisin family serine protease